MHNLLLTASPNSPGGHGAGVLFMAADTGRFLFLKRSAHGDAAGTWCCPGGGVEDYETIDQAVRRECEEEIGFSAPYELSHMHRDDNNGYTFHNHLAMVPTEFTPVLNEEHDDHVWSSELPENLHPGLDRSLTAFGGRQGVSV